MLIATLLEISKTKISSHDNIFSLEKQLLLGLASNNKPYQSERPELSRYQ